MSDFVVITNPTLDNARSVVALESLPTWEGLGWEVVGVTTTPNRDGFLTDEEHQAIEQAEAARLDAIVAPAKKKQAKADAAAAAAEKSIPAPDNPESAAPEETPVDSKPVDPPVVDAPTTDTPSA